VTVQREIDSSMQSKPNRKRGDRAQTRNEGGGNRLETDWDLEGGPGGKKNRKRVKKPISPKGRQAARRILKDFSRRWGTLNARKKQIGTQ